MSDYPAFTSELKFLISADTAAIIRDWARHELDADPHAVGFGGDGYQTTSLYFDTPDLDLFYRRGSYGRAKFRVRSYNNGAAVFFERKMKADGRVFKRRSDATGEDVARLE